MSKISYTAQDIVLIDIETNGLHRKKNEINYIGAYYREDGEDQFLILAAPFTPAKYKQLKKFCRGRRTCFHNGSFDTSFMEANIGWKIPIHEDTMLMAHISNPARRIGLKKLAMDYLGVEDWDISLKSKLSTGDDTIKYLKCDLKYNYDLYYMLHKEMTKKDIKLYYTHSLRVINAVSKMQVNGCYINVKRLNMVHERTMEKVAELEGQLAAIKNINWNSTAQLGKYLFDELGLPIIDKTPTGKPKCGAEQIEKLAKESDLECLELLLKYRKISKISKYTTQYKELEYEGRLYPSFNVCGTETGRFSSTDPNFQNIPRGKILRNLFTAPKGAELVEMDYSQIELRIAGYMSQDKNIILAYESGEDLHTATARIHNPNPTKEDRTKAKAMNFGLLYGMVAKTYKSYAENNYGVMLTQKQAEDHRNKFFKMYPNLLKYHRWCVRELKNNGGKVYNTFGRKRVFYNYASTNWSKKSADERQAINFPVQSMASDMLTSCIADIHERLPHVVMVGTVHDSIYFEISDPDDIRRIQKIMESPSILETYGIDIGFPIVADVEIGRMGDKKLKEDWSKKLQEKSK